jgi:6-phosphofructokinase 1
MDREQLRLLYYTPASGFTGTTRIKPMDDEDIAQLADVFERYRVRYFINIGGNGTIKQSMTISKSLCGQVQIASVAKTVDNDLGDAEFEKVLYTPGFPRCANYWRNKVWIMNQENLGACSHDKVLIAQTFGRKTGFLAGCARLGDMERDMPLLILLPEDQRSVDDVLAAIDGTLSVYGRAMVVLSEGYELGDLGERYDLSGQIMYGTSRTTAAQQLVNRCADNGIQARAFSPGFDQRSDIEFVSELDLYRAYEVGGYTVRQLLDGRCDFLGSITRHPERFEETDCIAIPFEHIGDYSREMPARWIAAGQYDVSDDYLNYVCPLLGNTRVNLPHIDGQLLFAERPGASWLWGNRKINVQQPVCGTASK